MLHYAYNAKNRDAFLFFFLADLVIQFFDKKNLIFVFTSLLLHAFQGEFPMTSYWKEDKKGLIVPIL